MKKVDPIELKSRIMGDALMNCVNSAPGIKFVVTLDDLLADRGLSKKDLEKLTGIKQQTITEFCDGKNFNLTKLHVMAFMVALRVTRLSDIIDIEFDTDYTQQADIEAANWIANGVIPEALAPKLAKE